MAYKGSNLILMAGSIEGSVNFFSYVTTDAIAAVLGTNYFTDASSRGMAVGDLVFVISSGTGYVCYVGALSAGGAATIDAAALAMINGSALPTSNPGPGSGLIWNNGGFLCVA